MKLLVATDFLEIPKDRKVFAGSYGFYVRTRKDRGVKVLKAFGFDSIEEMNEAVSKNNSDFEYFFKRLVQESALLVISYRSKFSPKFYKLLPIKIQDRFYLGLEMEHVQYELIYKKIKVDKDKRKLLMINKETHEISSDTESLITSPLWMNLREFVKTEFKKIGVGYTDCHLKNIVYVPDEKKIKVVDFSPDRVKIQNWTLYCKICEDITSSFVNKIELPSEHTLRKCFAAEKAKWQEEFYEQKQAWKIVAVKDPKNNPKVAVPSVAKVPVE